MEENNLEKFKASLRPRLLMQAERIDEAGLQEILEHRHLNELLDFVLLQIDDDDVGANVVRILDHCFRQRALLTGLYPNLSSEKSKYILIDYLTEKFKDKELGLQEDDLNFLVRRFRDCLNRPFDEASQVDHVELVKLSDLMCLLSRSEDCKFDRSLIDKPLITSLVETLQHCHTLGKQQTPGENPFRMITKLNQVNDREALSRETFFGFKSNLIGLLGNFAHSNRPVQDWIRELDGIALILDCTNIDARNPFIIQWSVFALRNILHNNAENQEFVKGVSKRGGPMPIDLSKIM